MTPERKGELLSSIAWAMVHDATPLEIEELKLIWDDIGRHLPIALAAAQGAKAVTDAIKANGLGSIAPAATV